MQLRIACPPMDHSAVRSTFRTLEPVHGMIYFVPEAGEEYAKAGLTGNRTGYFASRSAAMGAVGAEVVVATFFNFHPALVRHAMAGAWASASPARVIEARYGAVDRALRRAWTDDVLRSEDLREAAQLARWAAERACDRPEGRPLFAGHATLDWPEEPHLVLWHAQTLLREFRGDGHVAALTIEGLDGLDALIIHAATGDVPAAALKATRRWSDHEWDKGVDSLRERGLIEAGGELALTDAGREHRKWVEDRTDALAEWAYAALGDDNSARLRALGRPLAQAVVDAGLLTVDFARLLDEEPRGS